MNAKNAKIVGMALAALSLCTAGAAAPRLKGSPEAAGGTGLKIRTFAGSKAQPALTPKAQHWRFSRGEEKWTETHYDAREIWMARERVGEWKDKRGNVLTLAAPSAFCPEFEKGHAKREDIEKKMAGDDGAFADPDDKALARWAGAFADKTVMPDAVMPLTVTGFDAVRWVDMDEASSLGVFFRPKAGKWYYAAFSFADPLRPKEADTFVKTFLKGVVQGKAAARKDGISVSGQWKKFPEKDGYLYQTDLSLTQAQAFIKMAGRMMAAMREAYMRYVPPVKKLGVSSVRIFASREGYNAYMQGATGESGERSIGLWSPSHEELLILDQGNSARAETLKIMRHEAFHQYLFYATGRGNHAMWFNEGHACLFENVQYDAKKNRVRTWDDPTDRRAMRVSADPGKIAGLMEKILACDYKAFYAGTLEEVNDRYTAAWALVYFLQKGAPSMPAFSAYAGVLPAYMSAMAAGKSAEEATREAFASVAQRDLAQDFLAFWSKRTGARKYEPALRKDMAP